MLTATFVVSTIAACAIAMMMAPEHLWSLRYIFSDIGLFSLAIASFYIFRVAAQRRKEQKSANGACKEVEAATAEPVKKESKQQQFDLDQHVGLMQKYAFERNIGGTMKAFRAIQKSTGGASSLVYNIVLQAFINCGNVHGAEDWMETILEAAKADEASFNILIKGLVEAHAPDKARDLLVNMRKAGIQASIATFDDILTGFARANRFNESLSLLEQMHARGLQPTSTTLHTIEKLLDESRHINQSLSRIRQILCKFKLIAAPGDRTCISLDSPALAGLPRLAAVISQAEELDVMSAPCAHEVQVAGSLSQIKAVRKTLKQQGFLDESEKNAWPLDGHWETDDGLTVVIEGKLVRWGGQHASRLRFEGEDRRACTLQLYGKPAKGQTVTPAYEPQSSKQLRWDNGETWHSYDGRAIGEDVLFSQSMTKPVRDKVQDEAHRARACAVLKCVSKESLGLPMILEDTITQFLGGDLFNISIRFQSKRNPSRAINEWNPSHSSDDEELPFLPDGDADMCSVLSRRHPCVGLRHCWVEPAADQCGQRTLANGDEVDEAAFGRQIKMLRWA